MDELFIKRGSNHFSSSKLGLNKFQYDSEKKKKLSLKHHWLRVNHRARIPIKLETTKHEQKFHQICTTSREHPHNKFTTYQMTGSIQNLPYHIKFQTTPNGDKSTNQENQHTNNKCNHPSTSNTQHETDKF